MKRFRWQLAIIFLTGLVVGILIISEQPNRSGPRLSPEPVKGGNYTEAMVGSLQRLNPLLDFYNPVDRDVDRLIYSRLIRFDDRGNPQSDLAAKWGVSHDGTVYNIHLQDKALWHDGKPVTAKDVVFTVELMRSENRVVPQDIQDFWKGIEVNALSDLDVEFKLPEPFAPFLDYLSFGVLPEHLLGSLAFDQMVDANFNLQPIGSGPYKFGGLIVEDGQVKGLELDANKDYFGQQPYIEQMILRYYPDGASALKAYQEGIVQGINPVSPDILQQVLAEPNLSLYTGREPELSMVMFNVKDQEATYLQDKAVRKALLTGLNRQYIVDRLLNGQAILANGPIFPGTWAYYDGLPPITFDTDSANKMLDDAGWTVASDATVRSKDGVNMHIKLSYPDDEQHRAVAEMIQQNWSDLKIEVELEALPYDQLLSDRLEVRTYQAALVDLNLSRSPDPDPYPFWDQAQATGGQNYSQWDNRMASEYLERARTTTDLAERAKLYRNFQVIFSQELPALPLYYPVYTYAVDKQVGGVRMGPLFDTSDKYATVLDWFLVSKAPEQAQAGATNQP